MSGPGNRANPARAGEPMTPTPHKLPWGADPARAGEPATCPQQGGSRQGQPRAGGGTALVALSPVSGEGPTPRGRGNHASAETRTADQGANPARAGNRTRGRRGEREVGANPARAGESGTWWPARSSPRGQPRTGGGTVVHNSTIERITGQTLRRRGNLARFIAEGFRAGADPARAGEPLDLLLVCPCFRGRPRAGGGTCAFTAASMSPGGPTPRGRGTACVTVAVYGPMGPTPRGRGTSVTVAVPAPKLGPTPRGRGNLVLHVDITHEGGANPARAGEPLRNRGKTPGRV